MRLVTSSFFASIVSIFSYASDALARNIFLNGIDISNVQSQDLEDVNIHINEKGDLFIIAPHYNVNEENTYVPLSQHKAKQTKKSHSPIAHKPPRQIGGEMLAQPLPGNLTNSITDKEITQNPEPATITKKAGGNTPE